MWHLFLPLADSARATFSFPFFYLSFSLFLTEIQRCLAGLGEWKKGLSSVKLVRERQIVGGR